MGPSCMIATMRRSILTFLRCVEYLTNNGTLTGVVGTPVITAFGEVYRFDLDKMHQMNVRTSKYRHIKRGPIIPTSTSLPTLP